MPNNRKVVCDEQICEPELVLKTLEQINHPCLYRDIERRHRLVKHKKLRFQCKGSGDPDPLALSTGELVWIPVEVFFFEPDLVEERENPTLTLCGCFPVVCFEWLVDDLTDCLSVVETLLWVLKHHANSLLPFPELASR
jgi:hypothetical protein